MAPDVEAIAGTVLACLDGRAQIEPFTKSGDFSVADAFLVTDRLRRRRVARGERPVGRKIGFTNRSIWAEYGVYEPIWGDIYDRTLHEVGPGSTVAIAHLPEPRIEPEIVLGLTRDLAPGMTHAEIARAVGWVAHGFEIVQSIFPAWKFQVADCIADGGLHGLLAVGPRRAVAEGEHSTLAASLSALRLTLSRDGQPVDQGSGANALDGPIEALAHLVEVLGRDPGNPPLNAGEVVTTGTLTRAFPVAPGERWSTTIEGYALPGLSVVFA